MTELDAASRVALVAGAAVVAGPGASPSVIEATVVSLALMADPESLIMKRLVRIQDSQKFVAELVDVTIEQSSTRAILSLKTDDVTERKPDGIEQMRTERTDHPDGLSMYRMAMGLKGHRVLVYKEVQPTADPNKKVRICLHLTDLGMPDEKPQIDPNREQAVNVRVVANADGERVGTPSPEWQATAPPESGPESEAKEAYRATSARRDEPSNFLPYWSSLSKQGWSIADLLAAVQRTPEGKGITSLRHLDPNSQAGIALTVIVDRGRERAGV